MNKQIEWIKEGRTKGRSWEELRYGKGNTEADLTKFLAIAAEYMDWPVLSTEEWYQLVEQQRNEEEKRQKLIDTKGATVIHATNEQNLINVSSDEDSVWQCYKRLLLKSKGFKQETVNVMEDTNIKILRQLSRDTHKSGPIKGLVIGNVQSGKTANMAALMAMAADAGWNMFIVLSGMMENLRVQTLRRLVEDLNSRTCKINWEAIDNPKGEIEEYGKRLIDKKFTTESNMRYLTVCLKNAARLRNLIDWLNSDKKSRKDIRLLIIDDEADQASINTETRAERTAINRLILNLINNRNSKGNQARCNFQAVNYIGYTATPYANVLNEAPGPESLYPSNFIVSLSVSDEYFGPQQIFGYESEDDDSISYPGLDIIRIIHDNDIEDIKDIQEAKTIEIPESLVDAICWFLCGVAYMRYIGYRKPVSMLVHTSRLTTAHNLMGYAIRHFFETRTQKDIIKACSQIWERETKRFSKSDFMVQYYNYANSSSVNDYPEFENLRQHIEHLLSTGLTPLEINSNKKIEYSTGIHLCIDNSDNKNDNSRLIYPNSHEMPDVAPAFLVIGGNTLSRGFTIEGLLSTYFLRPAGCADTLMQMGRWFGYRKRYELIPRIWLSRRVRDQFRFISEMDQKLRDEIKFMAKIGQDPSECGPKIMSSPSTKFLKIVSDNKKQNAIGATYDFAGHTMETGVFTNDERIFESNLNLLSNFIMSLGNPSTDVQENPYAVNNKVWKNISLQEIKTFLDKYRYSERLKGFNDLNVFEKWLDKVSEEGLLGNWNVILAGIKPEEALGERQITDAISINKINRTRRYEDTEDGTINIGALRSFNDFLSDISVQKGDQDILSAMKGVKHNTAALNLLREKLGMSTIPQLVIYVISNNSMPRNNINRYPLNAKEDIVGFSINIPGIRKGKSTIQTLTVRINHDKLEDDGI